MHSSFRRILHRETRHWLWLGAAFLFFGLFLVLTTEVREISAGQEVLIGRADRAMLRFALSVRNPSANVKMIDLTALGSATVLTIVVAILIIYFLLTKRFLPAAHTALAGAGATLLTFVFKHYFERSRPDMAYRLAEVQGYSYPSGHSLGSAAIYFTCALILASLSPMPRLRVFFYLLFCGLIAAIGFSRIYLGVHYFSDVLAGAFIGIAWACLLGAAHAYLRNKKSS